MNLSDAAAGSGGFVINGIDLNDQPCRGALPPSLVSDRYDPT